MLTKVRIVKAMVFPVVMYRCENWTIKKAEAWRIDAFKLWCWRKLFRIPRTVRRSNQSILKKINPKYSLEGLMLSWNSNILTTWCKQPTHWKRPWCWEWLKAKGEGVAEDEMVRWHHQLNGHEFEQTPGGSEGQGSLACCSPWGHRVDTTQRLNNNISWFFWDALYKWVKTRVFIWTEVLSSSTGIQQIQTS